MKRGLQASRLTVEVTLELRIWLKCELQVCVKFHVRRGLRALRLGHCGEVETRVSTLASLYCSDAETRVSILASCHCSDVETRVLISRLGAAAVAMISLRLEFGLCFLMTYPQ